MGEPPARSIQHNGIQIAVAFEVPEGFLVSHGHKEVTAATIEDAIRELIPGARIDTE
jgi:hypothetical protein